MSKSLNIITIHLDEKGDLIKVDTMAADHVVLAAATSVVALILGSLARQNPAGAEDVRDDVIRLIDRGRVRVKNHLEGGSQ